ncbi:sister chromatid cohesion 1 protein 2-like [Pyrus ussuriensis x Pyrus communis]|uniref:Sister chromatid cohesion 1 protein 2-like n=1 Tax=Pyrus ussuriensis x Pyrus communis TaxID=2448454 RepID=A0A5N5GTM4_9ROSA|nr:sister chromatid cohesion 1 protein 2-like [Pyrus ussuriensis x Pyrus communis]
MFYSQRLLSRKGPLGGIWVAAYSFKKLKRSQVNQTDISASVDEILQDEWDAVAYRVLAYLLLGVVRIYSKKVEYLYDDCSEVLVKINKFVVSTKKNAGADKLRAPYYAVTLPDRFELDAFDLGILEIEDVSGGNVVADEEITLKDSAQGNGRGHFIQKWYHDYEEFGACDTPVKDVLSSHWLGFDMELRASSSGAKSAAVEPPRQIKPSGEGQETNGEQLKAPDVALSEVAIQGEANPEEKLQDLRLSHEGLNLETFNGTEIGPYHHVKSSGEDHQIDREMVMEPEFVQPESQTCSNIVQDHNLITVEAGMEKLQSCTVSQEEYINIDTFNGAKQPRGLVCSSGQANHNDGEPKKLPEMISPDSKERQIIMQEDQDPLSISCDGTPDVKIPDAGAPTFMVIHTPASKEYARFSRKRKCVMDDMIVLPNEVIRKSINDASDLVSKRKKVPQTALAIWKASRIANLCHDFSEPLVPAAVSRELRSLFCKKKLKITAPAEPFSPPEKLHAPESPSGVRSEQVEIAPETPVLRSQSVKSFGTPKSPDAVDMDTLTPETFGGIEKEEPPRGSREQAAPSGYAEEVPFLDRDQEHDFNLLNEDIDSSEGVNPQLEGLSGRTRMVARYLHTHFPNCKNRGKEEVNLLEVSKGRTKKENARLFYELLVLKTQGYVNVKQDVSYGDILISKHPKRDQTWVDDDMVNRGTSETMYVRA